MKLINKLTVTLITVLLLGAGCSKNLLEERPPHIIATETLYINLSGFEAGLNGLYALVRSEREGLNGSTSLVCNLFMNGVDNMVTNHTVSGFSQIAESWGAMNNPANAFYSDVFAWLYQVINSANTIINQAETKAGVDWSGPGGTPASNRLRIIAEARAVRAWAYRHLSYSWGDVPLSLTESLGSTIRTDWQRASVAEVRRQVIDDLLFAEQQVPVEPSLAGRITKGAIQHYLAEMYLAVNKSDSALIWAEKAIANPAYKLVTQRYGVRAAQPGVAFMDMFYDGNANREQGNSEALWVFQFQQETNGGGANAILRRDHHSRYTNIRVGTVSPLMVTAGRGGQGYGRMSLTKWAIDNYEPNDERGSHFAIRKFFILNDAAANAPVGADRLPAGYAYGDTIKLSWTNDITAASRSRVDWPFSRKADWGDPLTPGGSPAYNDQVYLRLAETYLLKAEAQLKLGRPADAATTINVLRTRAKASPVTASNITIDFILDERSRELLLEEHRRYTLLRTGKWLERTKLHNRNGGQLIAARDTLLPIPQTVIDANLTQEMKQNPGY
jgi:hypothetical protein